MQNIDAEERIGMTAYKFKDLLVNSGTNKQFRREQAI